MYEQAQRLAEAVRSRRSKLGISQSQLRSRGGPSEPTLIRIERASLPLPSDVTLAKLDKALDWEPGSAKAVLEGSGTPRTSELPRRTWVPGRGTSAVPIQAITDLIQIADTIGQLSEDRTADAGALRSQLADVHRELAAVLQPIYGAYVTHLLEQNRTASQPELNLLVPIFEHLLKSDMQSGHGDLQERQYRRWLAGIYTPDEETRQRFQARWKAATQ